MAGLLVLVAAASPASADAPKWVRTSWAGFDASESLAITWNTEEPAAPTEIEFGATPTLGEIQTGTSFLANGSLGTVHEVELVGLAPDTDYFYRVGGAGEWSEVYSFRTAPPPGCGSLRLVVLGDGRSQDSYGPAPQWPDIYAHALSEGPDAVIDTGDLVKDGDEPEQWVHYLEETAPLLPLAPHMPTLGNHDDDNQDGDYASFNQIFQLPRNDVTQTEDYYFFTYGDVIIVALSTSTYTGGTFKFQEQADWLDQTLTDNPRTWKLVFFHHPPYTSHGSIEIPFLDPIELNHPPNEVDQNAALVPVFDKHHVDLVLNGHNHFYERFSPMYGGGGNPDGNPVASASEGTTYLITGGAGAFTYDEVFGIDLSEDLICSGSNQAVGSIVCSGKHHFVVLDIGGDTLTGQVIATAAQNFSDDPDNIEILDTFSLVKAEQPAPCEPTGDPDQDAGSTQPEDGSGTGDSDAVWEPDADSSSGTTVADTRRPLDGSTDPGGGTRDGGTAREPNSDAAGRARKPGPRGQALPGSDPSEQEGAESPFLGSASATGNPTDSGTSSSGDEGCAIGNSREPFALFALFALAILMMWRRRPETL